MAAKFKPGNFDLAVRRSSAGRGLFTESEIPKGACVIEYVGVPLTKAEEDASRSKYLFEITDTKTIDGKPRINKAGYINHSCRPNCEPEIHRGRVFILAKRRIKAGEELNYNYGKAYFDTFIKPYGCRCAKCAPKLAPARAR